MANPNALVVATAASDAVRQIGMPEAQIILAHAALCVATSPKSNAVVNGIFAANDIVKNRNDLRVPAHLQDAHYSGHEDLGHGVGYKYAHNYPNHYVEQQYLPDGIEGMKFYEPGDMGYEKNIKEYFSKIKKDI